MSESELAVNSHRAGDQWESGVATLSDGGFVVTWTSVDQDGSGSGVYAQRYDAAGAAVGAEFQVNGHSAGIQGSPAITGLGNGGFVVIWTSGGQDGSGFGVYGQRYDAPGTPAGPEFRVNVTTAGDQWFPTVTALVGGGFVAVWESQGQDGSGMGIYARRYNAAGAAVGAEFQINLSTAGDQWHSAVVALPDGGFVVTWESEGQAAAGYDVYARRFAADSNPGVLLKGNRNANSLTGTVGEDTVWGYDGDDTLAGGAGDDELNGGGGADRLSGGVGRDALLGGVGNDRLSGGGDNDVLVGGSGADTMAGGLGADRFKFVTATDGQDTLTDFNSSEADKLVFVSQNFGGLVAGKLLEARFWSNETGLAHDADDRFVFETDSHVLWYDADGNRSASAPVAIAKLNVDTLARTDILMVAS